jgi:hypothetical protein
MGTEIQLLDMPDLLATFLLWRSGLPLSSLAHTVDRSTRQFPNAIRLAGWSHLFGNLMKHACNQTERWPKVLAALRVLCFFFRNESWRDEVVSKKKHVYPECVKLLRTFNAKFGKWRYETVWKVLKQLRPLRVLCEVHLFSVADIFGDNFQDKVVLNEVQAACRWTDLWVFIDAFFVIVINPLELGRHWGLVCSCCVALREAGTTYTCIHSSRRLEFARKFTIMLAGALAKDGSQLKVEDCEGVQWIWISISFVLRSTSQQLVLKTKWLYVEPWRMAEADDPIEAAEVLKQLTEGDESKMCPLSLRHKRELLPSLQARYQLNMVWPIVKQMISKHFRNYKCLVCGFYENSLEKFFSDVEIKCRYKFQNS